MTEKSGISQINSYPDSATIRHKMAEVRILSHMNKDHKLAIEDYLVVYGKVNIDQNISNIKLSQIDENQLTITFRHRDIEFDIEKPIKFNPPLKDIGEARMRLVEMAQFSAEKRGFAHYQIADYKYPSILGWLLIFIIHLPTISYFFPSFFKLLSLSKVLSTQGVQWVSDNLLNGVIALVVIHAFETMFILHPKLVKYRVPTDYKLEWYIAALVEGYPSIRRFNSLVSEKEH